ncbi:DNA polymerase kappa [Strongyloides ratti]|uniref:DNA polymerase kappa n=1 Tax=Strongyloides ratti TaxID=34506 RepID=A0A090KVE4_STRRB|nr:DNA polymerase kappa [Strongyloides ratti]CEF59835.1 DNA polymerase kappa [Strongyloides ratti]
MYQEKNRNLSHIMLHIDMDAFYASVEMRDDPSLRNIPMAVGEMSMLSTSNYHARKYGVRSGMPGFIGIKLCPKLKIVPHNFAKYRKASHIVQSIFSEYDSNLSMGSLDEAYMDITDFMKIRKESNILIRKRYTGECICILPIISDSDEHGICEVEEIKEICKKCNKERICLIDKISFGISEAEVVKEIRFRVQQATGLTCSAGIAANWLLAKICSDINKPNGQFELSRDSKKIMDFMRNLHVRKVNGIGQQTHGLLKAFKIETCEDIYKNRGILRLIFSELNWTFLIKTYLGIGNTIMNYDKDDLKRKSISVERTFKDTGEINECLYYLKSACNELIKSLEHNNVRGGYIVTLKCRKDTFERYTRSQSVTNLVSTENQLYSIAKELLLKEMSEKTIKYRLIGIGLSRLSFYEENDEIEELSFEEKKSRKKLYSSIEVEDISDDDIICISDTNDSSFKYSNKNGEIINLNTETVDNQKKQFRKRTNTNLDSYFKSSRKEDF